MKIILRKKAKEKGLRYYYTNQECKHSHVAARRVCSGACIQCEKDRATKNQSKYMKRYLKRHGKKYHYQKIKDWYYKTSEGHVQWRQDGRSKDPDYFKNWWKNNRKKQKEYYNKPYTKKARQKWNHSNKGQKNYYTRMRQKQIKQATPIWVNKEAIKQIYIKAAKLSKQYKCIYHVDHIIPLFGIDPKTKQHIVCGLHTIENLQILVKKRNLKKLNLFLVE